MNRQGRCGFLLLTMLLLAAASYGLEGRVVDAESGQGIAGATVTIGDHAVVTDASGRFEIDGSREAILARAPGYRACKTSAGEFTKANGTLRLTPFLPKAVYLSVYGIGSKPLRNAVFTLAANGPVNAVVIDIKGDRGLIPYPSAIPLANSDGARAVKTIPTLAGLVTDLHNRGIYAIARIVVFKDTPLATARPDLAVKRADGRLYRDREGLAWTDPFQPEVRNYNVAIALEAARAGFDEIQFDYVRFPDIANQLRFAQATTEGSRRKAIDGFLADARRQLIPYNVFLAVDIFGYVCWNTNDTGIGQQLEDIVATVDYISPMLYPSCFQCGIPGYRNPVSYPYQIVRDTLQNAAHRVNVSPRRFRPWLQAFKDYAFDRRTFGPSEIDAQIRGAADFGSDGWMLWNPRNDYGEAGLGASTAHGKLTGTQ